jgi:hypothetical protein
MTTPKKPEAENLRSFLEEEVCPDRDVYPNLPGVGKGKILYEAFELVELDRSVNKGVIRKLITDFYTSKEYEERPVSGGWDLGFLDNGGCFSHVVKYTYVPGDRTLSVVVHRGNVPLTVKSRNQWVEAASGAF